jgi:hypothetical protein
MNQVAVLERLYRKEVLVLKQDYILRQIELLIRVLTDSIGLTRTHDYKGGLKTLDGAFKDFFGWDSNLVNAMPEEYLIGMLKHGGVLDGDRAGFMAVLLKAEGDIYEAMEAPAKAYHRHLRALHLLLAIFEHGSRTSLPEELNQTDAVLEKLVGYQLPTDTRQRLWRHFSETGQYAKAEDTLFDLLGDPEAEPELLQQGIASYHALLARDDEELKRGALTREEVAETLRELEERAQSRT